MGIWHHIYIVTSTDASSDLGMLAEFLPDASVQTMPLHFDQVCGTFQTASHVLGIHIWGVWAPSQVVDRHMDSHSHCYHHRHFPRFGKVAYNWSLTFCNVQTMPLHLAEAVEPFKLHPMSMAYLYEVFEHILRLRRSIWLYIHIVSTTDTSPDLWKLPEIKMLPFAGVQTLPLESNNLGN